MDCDNRLALYKLSRFMSAPFSKRSIYQLLYNRIWQSSIAQVYT